MADGTNDAAKPALYLSLSGLGYIFSLYNDDETQDVVGRLCANDLECLGYSFHK